MVEPLCLYHGSTAISLHHNAATGIKGITYNMTHELANDA
jgi:hypothetical protein